MMQSVLVAVLAGSSVLTTALAAEENPKVKAEIQEMLSRHDKALNEHNLDAVMATFAANPAVVVMGTGPGERWVGQEEIKDAYKHFFADFDRGSLDVNCPWKIGGLEGKMAWLMAECQAKDTLQGKQRQYALNISAVLKKGKEGWRFQNMHFSNLTSGNPQ